MPNLTPPVGYPYALKAPLPHDDVNHLSEQIVKAPNADEGSSHAPTADLEWSGSMGGGFAFDTLAPFPFYGHLDVTSNLRFTAPVGGLVRFDALVALDVFGPLTLKAGVLANVDNGASVVFLLGATCTVASGATCNLSGATNVRGTMTFKSTANGGPGILAFEPDSQCYFATDCQVLASTNNWGWSSTSVQTHTAGSIVAGSYSSTAAVSWAAASVQTHVAGSTIAGAPTVTATVTQSGANAYRVLRSGTGPDSDTTINLWEKDIWIAAPTANRLWTLATPPGNAPFMALVVWQSGGGFSQSLTVVNGGPYALNATRHAALLVYDGATYHAVISGL